MRSLKTFLGLLLIFCSYSYSSIVYAQACSDLFSLSPSLFSDSDPIKLVIESSFSKLSKATKSESGKKNFPVVVKASKGAPLVGSAKGFGDSSAKDEGVTFSNLRISLNENLMGSKEVFIRTHFNNDPTEKWSSDGRLLDGRSPYREALVYDIAQTLSVPVAGHRRAIIEYHDIDTGEVITKPALLLENHANYVVHKGGKILSQNSLANHVASINMGQANVNVLEGLRAHLFEALIGNSDFALEVYKVRAHQTMRYLPFKNVDIFRDLGGQAHPLVYDFDISSIVAGYEVTAASKLWEALPEFAKDIKTTVVLKKLMFIRTRFKESEIKTILQEFKSKRIELEKTIQQAQVDAEGKKLALEHVEHFFRAVDIMWSKEFRFILNDKTIFYKTPNKQINLLKRNEIESRPATLREGTPFIILGEQNELLKIAIMDIHYDLKDYAIYIGYIKKDIKYSDRIPEETIPLFDVREMFQ